MSWNTQKSIRLCLLRPKKRTLPHFGPTTFRFRYRQALHGPSRFLCEGWPLWTILRRFSLLGLGASCSPWKSFWMSRHATIKQRWNSFYDDEKPYYKHGETPGETAQFLKLVGGGGNSNMFFGILIPKIGEDEPNLTSRFFKWIGEKTPSSFCWRGIHQNDHTLSILCAN